MSFLAPLFLAGMAALALPVVFHLIRRRTREQIPFSSLIFLRVSPPRLTRRSRLEDWLLLLLRCLVLGCLALAFARPFFRRPHALPVVSGTARREILLIDVSASMRRSGVWEAVQSRAAHAIRNRRPDDTLALYIFDRQVRPWMTLEQWSTKPPGERTAYALGRLRELQPGWASSDLGLALVRAAEDLADPAGRPTTEKLQVTLISDLQEGSRLQALAAYEWPKTVRLVVDSVAPSKGGNAGLQWVAGGTAGASASSGASVGARAVRVRVSNSSDAKKESFLVSWARTGTAEKVGTPISVYVPPGESRMVLLPLPGTNSPAGLEQVQLVGDDEAFDNRIGVIPPEPVKVRVLYLGTDATGPADARQPLFFLRRALEGNRRQQVTIQALDPQTPLSTDEVAAADWVVVTAALPAASIASLRDRMNAGGNVLLVLPAGDSSITLAGLAGVRPGTLAVGEAAVRGDVLLGDLDFKHPLLIPFADPRFSDFTHIHFWKYRKVDATGLAGARIPARFDTGDPAILDWNVGRGRLLVFASSWHPSDSQLAVSTKFVPLLESSLEFIGVGTAPAEAFVVGDPVPLERRDASGLQVRTPGGRTVAIESDAKEFVATSEPGVYAVETVGGGAAGGRVVRRFAVNVDPQESRTVPMPLETLERFGAPSVVAADDRSGAAPPLKPTDPGLLASVEAEAQQKLWKWSLTFALTLALLETGVAAWSARRAGMGSGSPMNSDPALS